MEKTIEQPGRCAACESENIEYGAWHLDGESGYYEIKCKDCGAHSRERYYLDYSYTITEEANAKTEN